MTRLSLCLLGMVLSGLLGNAHAAVAKRPPPPAPIEVRLLHELEGDAAAALTDLVMRFNQQARLGGLIRLETRPEKPMADTAPGHALPTLALLDGSNAMAFFGTRPRMRALDELMRKAGSPLAAGNLLPQLAHAVDDPGGRLQALPLALSLPVLLINRATLREAGLEQEALPRTWWDLQAYAGKLFDQKVACPLTSAQFAWVHMENLASQAGEPLVSRTGSAERALINGQIGVKHLALLSSWQKARYFHYFGEGREGELRFLNGECAMLTGSSALYVEARRRGMELIVAPLPFYDDVYGARGGDTLPDGMSLWVLAGASAAQEKLVARFVRFLLEPGNQREWVARTGFLPMTSAALDALREAGAFPPDLLARARARLSAAKPQGARFNSSGARERFRAIFGEELEPVWSSDRAPKEALDRTAQRLEAAPEMRLPSKR